MTASYADKLQRLANEKVWMPAQVHDDGMIENATQAYVRVRGADKGECNFKKMQKPTKHGHADGCDLGTYVMNMHVEYDLLKAEKGAVKTEIALDARVLRYGRYVPRKRLTPQDRIFAEAAKRATEIISDPNFKGNNNSTAQPTSTEAESKRIFVA